MDAVECVFAYVKPSMPPEQKIGHKKAVCLFYPLGGQLILLGSFLLRILKCAVIEDVNRRPPVGPVTNDKILGNIGMLRII